MKETEQIYKEIFKVLDKYQGIHVFDVEDMKRKSQYHLHELKLRNEYGMNIKVSSINNLDWNRLGDYMSICWMGEKYKRKVSWSDDGSQPIDEYMLIISFSTGAFIFGDGGMFDKDYPIDFFNQFWQELKSYSPKYIDTANHSLYFPIETCANMFNNFDNILKKYHELNREDIKQRRIAKMKQELAKLEV